MLVAPLVSPAHAAPRRPTLERHHATPPTPISADREPQRSYLKDGLLAWTVVGFAILTFVPAARGDTLFGATLPYWLVGAPLLNLAWLTRIDALQWVRRNRERLSSRRRKLSALRIASAAVAHCCRSTTEDLRCGALAAAGTGSSTAGSMPARFNRRQWLSPTQAATVDVRTKLIVGKL